LGVNNLLEDISKDLKAKVPASSLKIELYTFYLEYLRKGEDCRVLLNVHPLLTKR
jgi:hypothetical protein